MEQLTILGSGFAVANQYQDNTHLLVQTSAHTVLVDCGNNPVGKLERVGVPLNQVTDLILTHAHADHIGALPLLIMDMWLNKRTQVLPVYGLGYTLGKAKALLEIFDWQKWPGMFPVAFHEVREEGGQTLFSAADLTVTAAPVKHVVPNIGLRFSFGESKRVIVYSSDTEPCDSLLSLARGANILIQESAGPGKGHSTPAEAGQNAAQTGVEELVMIHYNPARKDAELLMEARQYFDGKITVAKDLLVLR
jgi:ribonuclease Z